MANMLRKMKKKRSKHSKVDYVYTNENFAIAGALKEGAHIFEIDMKAIPERTNLSPEELFKNFKLPYKMVLLRIENNVIVNTGITHIMLEYVPDSEHHLLTSLIIQSPVMITMFPCVFGLLDKVIAGNQIMDVYYRAYKYKKREEKKMSKEAFKEAGDMIAECLGRFSEMLRKNTWPVIPTKRKIYDNKYTSIPLKDNVVTINNNTYEPTITSTPTGRKLEGHPRRGHYAYYRHKRFGKAVNYKLKYDDNGRPYYKRVWIKHLEINGGSPVHRIYKKTDN